MLADGISNKHIEEMRSLGLSSGSCGAKLLGAGGGGFFAFCSTKQQYKKF